MTTTFKNKFSFRKGDEKELGFGNSVNTTGQRMMNPDGTSNVVRLGISSLHPINIYHNLIMMSWTKFNLMVVVLFLGLNAFFAALYLVIGMDQIAGVTPGNDFHYFMEAFFFSAQSFTTVGYGRVSPIGYYAEMLAALESLMGLLALALATGLLYGRFSRPTAKLLYSSNALISPYKDLTGFMFRIANARFNQLIEVEAQLIFSINIEENGKPKRTFHTLELELKKISLLTMSWTIVHPINDESPMKNLTAEDLKQADAEFMVMIKAIDDTYAQNVYARSSYKYNQVEWNAKFDSLIGLANDGRTSVDLTRISDFKKV